MVLVHLPGWIVPFFFFLFFFFLFAVSILSVRLGFGGPIDTFVVTPLTPQHDFELMISRYSSPWHTCGGVLLMKRTPLFTSFLYIISFHYFLPISLFITSYIIVIPSTSIPTFYFITYRIVVCGPSHFFQKFQALLYFALGSQALYWGAYHVQYITIPKLG